MTSFFDQELEKLILRVRIPARLQALEAMRSTKWTGYIATANEELGFPRVQGVAEEAVHEVAVKLLMGKLFLGYDESKHGPLLLRFKSATWNAIRNIVAKDQTRKRRLPAVPVKHGEEVPAPLPVQDDEGLIRDFRRLVHKRLGSLALAVLDTRLDGSTTQSLIGSNALGSPSANAISRVVREIKALAREFAVAVGDSELLRKIEQEMAAAEAAVEKRKATIAARTRRTAVA